MLKPKIEKFIIAILICGFIFSPVLVCVADADNGVILTKDGKKIRDSSGQGATSGNIAEFCSWIALGIAKFLGFVMTLIMDAVIKIFKISDYPVGGIDEGWKAVRDICNMFFVLVLLIIAFATILRLENYSVKRLLPKLIIMAILINFSKTICYLFIDFSNVIMLTFSNSFTSSSGSFIDMLGLKYLMKINEATTIDLESWNLFAAIMLANAALLLTIIIFIMFIVTLLARIIMLWILIILSPIAFFASVLPATSKYASQWWGQFSRYLMIGPAIAFFTWLALSVVMAGNKLFKATVPDSVDLTSKKEAQNFIDSISAFASWDNLSRFILGIGLLIGTLAITKQIGAIGASVGMSMANRVKNTSLGAGKKALGATKRVAVNTGKNIAKFGARTGIGLAGKGLQSRIVGKEGSTGLRGDLHKAGAFMGSWKNDMQTTRQNAKRDKRLNTLKKMGMRGKSLGDLEEVADSKLGRGIKHTTTAAGAVGLGLATGGIGWATGGAVVGSRLVAGKLKRGQVDRQQEREKDKEQGKQDKQAEIAHLEQNKEEAKKNLELQLKHDPSENIAKKEAEKEKTIKDLNSVKEVKIKNLDSLLKKGLIAKEEHGVNKQNIEKEHNEKVERVNQKHEENIKEENTKRLAPEDYDKQLRKLDTDFKIQKNDINAGYAARIKNIDSQESWADKQMKKYQPNRVTIEAVRKGADDYKTAEKRVNVLGKGDSLHKFSPTAFYSASGQSTVQHAFFEKLASEGAASTQALSNINKTLGQIAAGELKLSKQERESIKNFKQGLAAYKNSGGDISRFEQTINQVNNIHTGDDEEGRKTVEDFEDQVIITKN